MNYKEITARGQGFLRDLKIATVSLSVTVF